MLMPVPKNGKGLATAVWDGKRSFNWLLACICASLAAMTPENEIRLVLEEKAAALVARNALELAALIHSGFMYVNASGRSFDKTAYIDAYCTSGRIVFAEQRFSNLEVKPIDDFAVATLYIDDELRIGERVVSGRYKSLCVFSRFSGRWQWAAGQTMTVEAA